MRDTRGGQKEDSSGLTPNNIPLIDNPTTDVHEHWCRTTFTQSVSCDSAARLSLTHPWHNSTTFLKKENGLFWLPATILLVDNLTTGLMLRTKWYTAFCSMKTNHFPFYSSLSLDELLWLNRQFIFDSSLTQLCHFPTGRKGVCLTPNNIPLMTTDHWADIHFHSMNLCESTNDLFIFWLKNLKTNVPWNPWVNFVILSKE